MIKKVITTLLVFILSLSLLCACAKDDIAVPIPSISLPTMPEASATPETSSAPRAPALSEKLGAAQEKEDAHVWVPANYQAPETCSHCGETKGAKVLPAFEELGAKANMEEGAEYAFQTITGSGAGVSTVGKVRVMSYDIFDSDAKHEAKEGYEYRKILGSMEFSDENARKYGIKCRSGLLDYYSGRIFFEQSSAPVNYYGEEITCKIVETTLTDAWRKNTYLYEFEFVVQVPKGYDGFVLALYDAKLGTETVNGITEVATSLGAVVEDNTRFFRLK